MSYVQYILQIIINITKYYNSVYASHLRKLVFKVNPPIGLPRFLRFYQ
jgi:hypothetical protein